MPDGAIRRAEKTKPIAGGIGAKDLGTHAFDVLPGTLDKSGVGGEDAALWVEIVFQPDPDVAPHQTACAAIGNCIAPGPKPAQITPADRGVLTI